MLDVSLLGTSGMMPLPNRFLTALLCRTNGRFLLIDAGEGTQVTMKMLGWGFKNLDVICFTHFHADHIAGLPGLLLTIGNSGRTENITIIGPAGITNIVKSLCIIAQELPFKIDFIELSNDEDSIKIGDFIIKTLRVEHRVSCFSYSILVHRLGKFDVNKAKLLDLPRNYWSILQNNKDVEYEGKIYTSDMVVGEPRKGIKVTYTTDTRPISNLVNFAKDSDLFICEGIYGDDEKLNKAIEYKHMLFSEAANIAKNANVSELWLTHFSPSMTNPDDYIEYAKNIFPNTMIGKDRMQKSILFS